MSKGQTLPYSFCIRVQHITLSHTHNANMLLKMRKDERKWPQKNNENETNFAIWRRIKGNDVVVTGLVKVDPFLWRKMEDGKLSCVHIWFIHTVLVVLFINLTHWGYLHFIFVHIVFTTAFWGQLKQFFNSKECDKRLCIKAVSLLMIGMWQCQWRQWMSFRPYVNIIITRYIKIYHFYNWWYIIKRVGWFLGQINSVSLASKLMPSFSKNVARK